MVVSNILGGEKWRRREGQLVLKSRECVRLKKKDLKFVNFEGQRKKMSRVSEKFESEISVQQGEDRESKSGHFKQKRERLGSLKNFRKSVRRRE